MANSPLAKSLFRVSGGYKGIENSDTSKYPTDGHSMFNIQLKAKLIFSVELKNSPLKRGVGGIFSINISTFQQKGICFIKVGTQVL